MIPNELKSIAHWVVWRYEPDPEGQVGKIPYQPHKPTAKAASTRPIEWSDFETAERVAREGLFSGVGFVVTEKDGLTGIDLDHAIKDGVTLPWAVEVVRFFDSYTEVTPSGNGLRVWVKGTWKGSRNRWTIEQGQVEIYSDKRYFTVSGMHVEGTPTTIEERQTALDLVAASTTTPKCHSNEQRTTPTPALGDEEIISRLSKRNAFSKLWIGDTSDYQGDESRADLALCSIIALYTSDPDQVERLMSASALGQRGKWQKRSDYRARTIRRALS